MAGTGVTGNVFVARRAGDVFPDARRNDLLLFTDLPGQQILVGARPDGDVVTRQAMTFSDSNVTINAPALDVLGRTKFVGETQMDGPINVNGQMTVNQPLEINSDLVITSDMTMVNELMVADANLTNSLTVRDGENGPVLFIVDDAGARFAVDTLVQGTATVHALGVHPGAASNAAMLEADAAGVRVGDGAFETGGTASLNGGVLLTRDSDVTVRAPEGVRVGGGGVACAPRFDAYAAYDPATDAFSDQLCSVEDAGVAITRAVDVASNLRVRTGARVDSQLAVFADQASGDAAFRADDTRVDLARSTFLRCNVLVEGAWTSVGPSLTAAPDGASVAALHVDASQVSLRRPLDAYCNLRVLGGAATTDLGGRTRVLAADDLNDTVWEADAAGVRSTRPMRVEGADWEVEDGGSRVLRAGDSGVVVDRALVANCNIDVGGAVTLAGDLTVEGETVLQDDTLVQGTLTVQNGTGTDVVFSVTPNDVSARRSVFARCNVVVEAGALVSGGATVRSGGTRALDVGTNTVVIERDADAACNLRVAGDVRGEGELDVLPNAVGPGDDSTRAFRVRDAGIEMMRAVDIAGDVSVVGTASIAPVAGSALTVESSPAVARATNLDLRVEGGDAYVSGDVDVRSNLRVGADPTDRVAELLLDAVLLNRAVLARAPVEVRGGTLAVRPGATSNAATPPSAQDAQTAAWIDDQLVRLNRETHVRSADGASVEGGAFRVRPVFSPNASADALRVTDAQVDVLRPALVDATLRTTGAATFESNLTVEVPAAASNVEILAVSDARVRVSRDASVYGGHLLVHPGGSNAGGDSNAALHVTDAAVRVRRDLEVDAGASVFLEGGGDAEIRDGDLRVWPDAADDAALEVTDASVRLARDVIIAGSNVSDVRCDVRQALTVRHQLADGTIVGDFLLAAEPSAVTVARDAVLRSNLRVDGDVNIGGNVTSDAVLLKGDLVTEGDADVLGDFTVRPASCNVSADEDVLSVTSSNIALGADVRAASNLVVTRRADLVGGALEVFPAGTQLDGGSNLPPALFSVLGPYAAGAQQAGSNVPLAPRARFSVDVFADENAVVGRDTTLRRTLQASTEDPFDGSTVAAGLFVDENLVRLERPTVTVQGGDLRVARAASADAFLVNDANASELFRVAELRVTASRDALLRSNVRVEGDAEFVGDDYAVFPGDRAGGTTGAYTDAALHVVRDAVTVRRPLTLDGSNAFLVRGGDTELLGNLAVRPDPQAGNTPVLAVADSQVDVNRPLNVVSDVALTGDAQIASNLVVGADAAFWGDLAVRPGGSNAPLALDIDDTRATVGTELQVSSNVTVAGSAFVDGLELVVGGATQTAFAVRANEVRASREAAFDCNVTMASDAAVRRDFTVGNAADVAFAVVESAAAPRVELARELETTSNVRVNQADLRVTGDVRIDPGGTDALTVDGTRVTANQEVRVAQGDVIVAAGNLSVSQNGDVCLSAREAEVAVGRDLTTTSNMRVDKLTDLRGDLLVRPIHAASPSAPAAFSVDQSAVVARRDLRATSNLSVEAAAEARERLTVKPGVDAVLNATDAAVEVNRELRARSNLHVDGADALVTGDLRVNPGGADAFEVRGTRVDAYRDLHVDGDVYVTGEVNSASDARLKKNVRPVLGESALAAVDGLRACTFNFVHESEGDEERNRHVGYVAQEVAQVLPEVVSRDADTGFYGVKYGNIVAVLSEAVKELDRRNRALEQRLARVESSRMESGGRV